MESFAYAYQDFVDACEQGKIRGYEDRSQIETASFEPLLASSAYIIESQMDALFRPQARKKIENVTAFSHKVSLQEGYELKRGFTYLIPLQESVQLEQDEYLKSSPKSSLGRLFLNTRMIADYNLGFDEIHPYKNRHLQMYLIVQPLQFNVTVYEGSRLNQIRVFKGLGSQVRTPALLARQEKEPFLLKRFGRSLRATDLRISDNVYLHLDLLGFGDDRIVGLRAKNNPQPIDIEKKYVYDVYDYFEPLHATEDCVTIDRHEYYLFSSKEVFRTPATWNAEVHQHSTTGISGPVHFAGFIDNGFEGNLVFEIRSDEVGTVKLYDGMPVSKVQFFKTKKPSVLYGEESDSHYNNQGLRVAKYFQQQIS